MININNRYIYVESGEELKRDQDRRVYYHGGIFNEEDCHAFPRWFKCEESWDAHFMDSWLPIEKDAPEILETIQKELICCAERIDYLTKAIDKIKE
jgi:hypothetical protein